MRSPHTAVAFLVAAATALSASIAAAPAGAAGMNACALVTTAEASAAMHVKSLPGKALTDKSGSSCRYYSPDHTKNVFVQSGSADDMTGAMQMGGKTVPGIGDKAVWAMGSLFVQKGGKVAQVGLYLNAASMKTMDAAIVPLGRAAASRM